MVKELTPFFAKGFTEQTIFKVTRKTDSWYGKEVILVQDDGDEAPWFVLLGGNTHDWNCYDLPDPDLDYPELELVSNPVVQKDIPNSQGGIKFDGDKEDWTLLPIKPIKTIVEILMIGAKKYDRNNWTKVEPERYKMATWRHWTAWCDGERNDPETGKSHLAHIGCNILFLLWFELTGKINE